MRGKALTPKTNTRSANFLVTSADKLPALSSAIMLVITCERSRCRKRHISSGLLGSNGVRSSSPKKFKLWRNRHHSLICHTLLSKRERTMPTRSRLIPPPTSALSNEATGSALCSPAAADAASAAGEATAVTGAVAPAVGWFLTPLFTRTNLRQTSEIKTLIGLLALFGSRSYSSNTRKGIAFHALIH